MTSGGGGRSNSSSSEDFACETGAVVRAFSLTCFGAFETMVFGFDLGFAVGGNVIAGDVFCVGAGVRGNGVGFGGRGVGDDFRVGLAERSFLLLRRALCAALLAFSSSNISSLILFVSFLS